MSSTNIYYLAKRRQFTKLGTSYIIQQLEKNPRPNDDEKNKMVELFGCTMETLMRKLTYESSRKKSQGKLQIPPPIQINELSIGLSFLNKLKMKEARAFQNELAEQTKSKLLINENHIKGGMTIHELKEMTSNDHRNGQRFFNWMCCLIRPIDIESPLTQAPAIKLNVDTLQWKSVEKHVPDYCKQHNTQMFQIKKHHVTLKSKEKQLPVLSPSGETASHLCDTNGCISQDHIILEAYTINHARIPCEGARLLIRPATTTSPPHIIKSIPCIHGTTHPKFKGDPFEFTCRKILFLVQDSVALDFFKSINFSK